ncbi:putative transposase [Candidatus Methanophagaceae archaeon]|jgi:transposase-like protein|nr:putative transposase [Methanophagales archaeon]
MPQRKTHSANTKAKAAIDAIREDKTTNELAGIYGVHPNQIGLWKKKILEAAPMIFSRKGNQELKKMKQEQKSLYQRIGELTMEVGFLKKKL